MNERSKDEWISAYLDDELSPQERVLFERELAEDSELQQQLDELQSLSGVLSSLPRRSAPPELFNRVMAKVTAIESNTSRDKVAANKTELENDRAVASANVPVTLANKNNVNSDSLHSRQRDTFASSWRIAVGLTSGVAAMVVLSLVLSRTIDFRPVADSSESNVQLDEVVEFPWLGSLDSPRQSNEDQFDSSTINSSRFERSGGSVADSPSQTSELNDDASGLTLNAYSGAASDTVVPERLLQGGQSNDGQGQSSPSQNGHATPELPSSVGPGTYGDGPHDRSRSNSESLDETEDAANGDANTSLSEAQSRASGGESPSNDNSSDPLADGADSGQGGGGFGGGGAAGAGGAGGGGFSNSPPANAGGNQMIPDSDESRSNQLNQGNSSGQTGGSSIDPTPPGAGGRHASQDGNTPQDGNEQYQNDRNQNQRENHRQDFGGADDSSAAGSDGGANGPGGTRGGQSTVDDTEGTAIGGGSQSNNESVVDGVNDQGQPTNEQVEAELTRGYGEPGQPPSSRMMMSPDWESEGLDSFVEGRMRSGFDNTEASGWFVGNVTLTQEQLNVLVDLSKSELAPENQLSFRMQGQQRGLTQGADQESDRSINDSVGASQDDDSRITDEETQSDGDRDSGRSDDLATSGRPQRSRESIIDERQELESAQNAFADDAQVPLTRNVQSHDDFAIQNLSNFYSVQPSIESLLTGLNILPLEESETTYRATRMEATLASPQPEHAYQTLYRNVDSNYVVTEIATLEIEADEATINRLFALLAQQGVEVQLAYHYPVTGESDSLFRRQSGDTFGAYGRYASGQNANGVVSGYADSEASGENIDQTLSESESRSGSTDADPNSGLAELEEKVNGDSFDRQSESDQQSEIVQQSEFNQPTEMDGIESASLSNAFGYLGPDDVHVFGALDSLRELAESQSMAQADGGIVDPTLNESLQDSDQGQGLGGLEQSSGNGAGNQGRPLQDNNDLAGGGDNFESQDAPLPPEGDQLAQIQSAVQSMEMGTSDNYFRWGAQSYFQITQFDAEALSLANRDRMPRGRISDSQRRANYGLQDGDRDHDEDPSGEDSTDSAEQTPTTIQQFEIGDDDGESNETWAMETRYRFVETPQFVNQGRVRLTLVLSVTNSQSSPSHPSDAADTEAESDTESSTSQGTDSSQGTDAAQGNGDEDR